MKKIYFLFSLGLLASAAVNAQQIDGTFDEAWKHSCPWDSKNLDGYQKLGNEYVEPAGWQISNVSGLSGTGATRVGAQVEGRSGYAVQLTNTANAFKQSQIVPAYLTLGTPWATSYTKSILKDPEDADGGTWGCKAFNYRPDAITFYYKRSHGKNSQQNASVVAYLWKGTYTQADVPANNTLLSAPAKVTMEDRDRQVLGIDMTNCQGGATSATEGATCIAKVNSAITGDAADWTPFTAEFNYTSNDAPEKINVIFAACDYFADRSNHVAGDQLIVDDVQLVYYHTLSALSYNGKSILEDGKTAYDLSTEAYDASKLAYTKKAKGGTVETSFDDATALLTISVKGDNYAADNTSATAYTVQFKKGGGASDATVVSTNNYAEKLVVTINGQSTDSIPANIVVDHMSDGTVTFSLKNFYLPADESDEEAEPMYVGNITLEGVTVEQADGYETIATDQKITIKEGTDPADAIWLGPMLGEIPVKLSGKLTDKKLYVNIDIDMQESLGQTINVVVGKDSGFVAPKPTVVSTNTYDQTLVVSINDQSTDPIPAKIVVDHMSDGTITFSLKNFYLPADESDEGAEPMYVGNITLEGVTVEQADGYETIATDQKITIEEGTDPADAIWLGPMLGEIPVKLSGKLTDKKLYVNIDIDMQESLGQTINVVVGKEGDVTGIHSATVAPASSTDAIYTLGGIRVSKATKGVYIINGKKVIK